MLTVSSKDFCILSIRNDITVLSERQLAFDCIVGTLYCLQTAVSSVDIINMLMMQQSPVLNRAMQKPSSQWPKLSVPRPDRPRQDSRTQIRLVMAARAASASGNSAESKRTDLRANEKKCCEWFVFPLCSLTVKCDSLSHLFCIIIIILLNSVQKKSAVNGFFDPIFYSVGHM